jgi:hypothetical protein
MIGISPEQKKGSSKKGSKDWKDKKRGETSLKKLHVLRKEKKEGMKFTSYRERLSKERKKERKKERRSQFPVV